jgi:hypothetical protein
VSSGRSLIHGARGRKSGFVLELCDGGLVGVIACQGDVASAAGHDGRGLLVGRAG